MELYLLGYVGGYMISCSAPFQLYQSWQLQSTKDLSWRWVCTYLTGAILLFAYTCHEDVRPVWIPMTLEVSCTALLLSLKFWLEVVRRKRYAVDAETQTSWLADEQSDALKPIAGIVMEDIEDPGRDEKEGSKLGVQLLSRAQRGASSSG